MALDPALSKACFKRDGYRCRNTACKSRNGLHPHHVIYQSHQGPDELSNLISLCACCHRAVHNAHLLIEVLEQLENDVRVKFAFQRGWRPGR